jgi:GNAT superfamily N-acetyltransferase
MAIQRDWLQPLITAPYLPTLGPVHPQAMTPKLFTDVIEAAGTGRLLPYDKDRRWADCKDEQVLPEEIVQEPGVVMIPTLRAGRVPCIRVYIYHRPTDGALSRAAELGRGLCERFDAEKGRLSWFLPPGSGPDPVAACTRIQMRTFSPAQLDAGPEAPAGVIPLEEVPEVTRMTFSAFAQKLAADGFAFLETRIRDGGTGPVLTVQRDGVIAGAIGPMEIMPDNRGAAQLLPQYFGVLPTYRGHGLGRCLWRAAMHWGQRHRAAYQLLQTQVGGASDRLCQSEGLTDLGLVCTTTF